MKVHVCGLKNDGGSGAPKMFLRKCETRERLFEV